MVLRLAILLAFLLELIPFHRAIAGDLLVIANPSIGDIPPLSLDEITAIYLLRVTVWPNGLHIIPINREIGSDARADFTATVLKQDMASLAAYWNEMHFRGKLPPLVQESEPAMIAFVQRVPGALGYVSASTPTVGVKVIGHVH